MEYQIVCQVLNSDKSRIERIGIIGPNGNKEKADKVISRQRTNEILNSGHKIFFTNEEKKRAQVSEFGEGFIKTDPDGVKYNNLRKLRGCGTRK